MAYVPQSQNQSNSDWNDLEGLVGEEELEDNEYKYLSRDHVLFCIDASASMQTVLVSSDTDEPSKSPFHLALEVVLAVERGKVLSGPNDSVGVVVYNVDSKNPKIKAYSQSQVAESQSQSQNAPPPQQNFSDGCFVFQPLRGISAGEIKRLKQFLEAAEEQLDADPLEQPQNITEQFPPRDKSKRMDMADVLECCNSVFRDAGTKINGQKRIFLITDDDNPDAGLGFVDGVDTRNPARTRYADLNSLGVVIDPFFITKEDEAFDENLYWNDILFRQSPDSDSEEDPTDQTLNQSKSSASNGLDELKDLMAQRAVKRSAKRVVFSLVMNLGALEFGVSGYSLIATANKPTYKYYNMTGQETVEVQPVTKYYNSGGTELSKDEIATVYSFGKPEPMGPPPLEDNEWAARKHYYDAKKAAGDEDEMEQEDTGVSKTATYGPLGGKRKETALGVRTKLAFRPDEILEIKNMKMDPQIKILGFHRPENLRFDHNVKHSVFLYPDEKTYAGSTRTFTSLLATCINKGRYALAICVLRKKSSPIMACLIPQRETFNEDGSQDAPPGFHLIPLPFADDIRARPAQIKADLAECTDEQKDQMKKIIQKLKVRGGSYNAQAYPNPSLAFFYGKLQSLAFEEEFIPENTEDKTLPQYEPMKRVGGKLMEQFNQLILSDERSYAVKASTNPRKRAAPDDEAPGAYDTMIELTYKSQGSLPPSKFTVAMLMNYVKSNNIPVDGKPKKADLLLMVESNEHDKQKGVKKQRIS